MSRDTSAAAEPSREERTDRAVAGLHSALKLGDGLLKSIQSPGDLKRRDLARRLAAYGIATYSLWTTKGILVLLEAGFSQQTLPLARVLWELRVTQLFIEQQWEVRAQRFLMYDVVIRHRYLTKAVEASDEPWARAFLEDPARVESLRAEYQAAVAKDPELDQKHWAGAGMNTKRMAEAVGMAEEYRFLYAWLSERVHGSVRAIGEAFSHVDDERIDIRPPDYTLEVAATTAAGLCQLLLILSEVFELGEQPEVRQVLQEL